MPLPVPTAHDEVRRVRKALYHRIKKFRGRLLAKEKETGAARTRVRWQWKDTRRMHLKTRQRFVKKWQEEGTPSSKHLRLIADAWAQGKFDGCVEQQRSGRRPQRFFMLQCVFEMVDQEAMSEQTWPSVNLIKSVLKVAGVNDATSGHSGSHLESERALPLRQVLLGGGVV